MAKEIALRYWVERLRRVLGRPRTAVIPTSDGPQLSFPMPLADEMALALGMSVTEFKNRLAGSGLCAFEVSQAYVGCDATSAYYRFPVEGVRPPGRPNSPFSTRRK